MIIIEAIKKHNAEHGNRLVPTVFLPLSLLSYTSILGLLSTVLLIIVVLVDGTFKKETPGSFWDPAETNLGVASMSKLGVAFGLFMAGVSLHPPHSPRGVLNGAI